jgi:hypothetical protein
MNHETDLIHESNKVGIKVIGGEEAEAVAEVVAAAYPEAEIEHYPAYISIEVPNRLVLDLPQISEQLGRPYDVPAFLVILSSYNGRISVEDERITIATELV